MGGQLTKAQMEKMDPELLAELKRRSELIREQMSPKGALGLPEHLDERRLEHGIIDGYFDNHALFEKVFVYPIEEDGGVTYGGGRILRTDEARDKDRLEAPRGILISAGLKALDVLASNGIRLGDIVTFTRGAVTRIRAGWVGGKQEWVTVLYVDDLSGSLDVAARARGGELTVELDGHGRHYYKGSAMPQAPSFTGNM